MERLNRIMRLALASALVFASINANALDLKLFGEGNQKFSGSKASVSKPVVGLNASKFASRLTGGISKGGLRSKVGLFSVVAMGAAVGFGSVGCGGGGSGGGGSVSCTRNQLNIFNDTWLETFDVYVNGFYVTSISAGFTKGLCLSAGTHDIEIYESYSGDLIFTDSISFVGESTVIGWDVTDPFEAQMDVDNQTSGWVRIEVDGIWYDTAPDGYWSYPVRSGTHSVYFEDDEDGEVLYNEFDSFSSGITYIYTVVDPACVEFDIFNDTGESVDVYIDGFWQDTQPDFTTWSYWVDNGFHSVRVESAFDGFVYYTESGNYSCGTYFIDVF